MWFAGIDWADEHHDCVVLDQTGQVCLREHISHSAAGVSDLVSRLHVLTGPQHLDELVCVLETKANLLVTALLEAGIALYPINPKMTDRWRPASGAKSDQNDALILAKIARSDWRELTRLQVPEASLEQLRTLVHDQQALIKEQTRLSNQLKACLKQYYPAVLQGLSTDMTQKSLLAFLQAYPTPQLARQASYEDIVRLFKGCRNTHAASMARRICERLQQPALEATSATVEAKAQLVKALVPLLLQIQQSIEDYAQQITQLYEQQPDYALFESLPGVGERLGPQLVAELSLFAVADVKLRTIQQLAGAAPVTKQSGKSRQVKVRRACTKTLRNTLYQFCVQSLKYVPWARAFYRAKLAQGKNQATAMRSLGTIWLRIIWAMRREQQPYQEERFLQAQAQHLRRVA